MAAGGTRRAERRGGRRPGTLVGLLIAVAVMAGCSGLASEGDDGYPASIRVNFMTACESNGGTADQCRCAVDELEDHVTLERFFEIEAEMNAGRGTLPPEVIAAVTDCV